MMINIYKYVIIQIMLIIIQVIALMLYGDNVWKSDSKNYKDMFML